MQPLPILAVLLSALVLASCTPAEPPAKPWREELTIAITTDQESVEAEFRQQLIHLFAKKMQVPVRLVSLPAQQIIPALMTGRVHMAAAGMRSNVPPGGLIYPAPYQTVREQLVCLATPRKLDELVDKKITVIAESPHDLALRELKEKLPALNWEARSEGTTYALLWEVAEGKLECTVANEEQIAMARNFHPRLIPSFEVSTPSELAWGFPPDGDPDLFEAGQEFFTQISKDGTLHRLLDRFYSHNDRLEAIDSTAFLTAAQTVLPRYRRMFEEAERLTGIEWQLLAALAYQESHWNPLATSFTNVRGMMMLTGDTADRMNVSNRLDPYESIMGGARYLQLLKDQLPARINERERVWLALAAYNQGMGHLEDARRLAARAGMNPDTWADVKITMRWLALPEYLDQTRYGYARGGEAVALVENVRIFYDMLKRLDLSDPPRPPEGFQLHMPDMVNFNWP